MGFYDLRLDETMIEQAKLAKEYGIEGFMFYHYWFSGKRLLERPVEQWLKNKTPDFPFMLCWANENWTRRWDGRDKEILIKQDYGAEDDENHFNELLPYFKDTRYIRVHNKPVFVVYRCNLFPDIKKTADTWQRMALANGLDGLYLITVEALGAPLTPETMNFDAALRFQPDWTVLPEPEKGSLFSRFLHKSGIKKSPFIVNNIFDYRIFVENAKKKPYPAYKLFPSVTPMWDNSARRKNGATVFINSDPDIFNEWLTHTIKEFRAYSDDENFIFINAWNEWAEGNHLEPCRKWGNGFLQAIKNALVKK
jgi:lipopolysaccharide biosynthesis protein